MQIRNRESYLSSIPDGSPKKRKTPRIFKVFYFSVLLLFVGLVFYYYLMHSVLYVYGTGSVVPERFYVPVFAPCEVIKYFVEEKQSVKIGDPLVEVKFIEMPKDTSDKNKFDLSISSIDKKIIVLEKELKQRKIELQEAILFKSLRKEKPEDNTILSSEREDYSEIKDEVDKLIKDINLLQSEKSGIMTAMDKDDSKQNIKHTGETPSVINSRMDGYVSRILKKRYEYADKGTELLIIEDPSVIIVDAIFKTSFLKFLDEGKQVLVEFPNGQTADGVIYRTYTSSYYQGQRLPQAETVVEIKPLKAGDSKLWEKYKGLDVKVRARRL